MTDMIRLILLALVVYFAVTLFRSIIRIMSRHSDGKIRYSDNKDRSKKKETYRDVKDADFIELDKKDGQDDQEKRH